MSLPPFILRGGWRCGGNPGWPCLDPCVDLDLLPLDWRVLTDGLRVASGDKAGVKFGEKAKLEKLDSWLIGLWGKLTILVNWLVLAELVAVISWPRDWLSTRGGVAVIIGGGPPSFIGWGRKEDVCGIVCIGLRFGCIVSSLRRAISANTSANGWNCGPQFSK